MKTIFLSQKQIQELINETIDEQHSSNHWENGTYMVLQNLVRMKEDIEKILSMKNHPNFPKCVTGEHAWASDHVSTSKDDIEEVANFIETQCGSDEMNEAKQLDEKCWDGYKAVGGKMKNGKRVPNCVPVKEAKNMAQQAAIAINMKKKGQKPKDMSEQEMYESMQVDESKNCPTDPAKWAASKAAAKAKFDVYPSAYANGWAAKNYKSKGGGWRKCK